MWQNLALENMSYKISKSVYVLTSGLALGIGAYAFYRYWKTRESKCIDEGFEDVSTSRVYHYFKRLLVVCYIHFIFISLRTA